MAIKKAANKPAAKGTESRELVAGRKAKILKKASVVTGGSSRQVEGFVTFIRQQGVVGLAVGLAIGAEASVLVKQIVSSIVTPILDLIVGKGGLTGIAWTVKIGDRTGTFTFGMLVDELIRFLAVALVIYIVIHGFKLDRLDKKKD